jgi:hypothetical protein
MAKTNNIFFFFFVANVKQVLTILSAIIIFDLVISPTNLLGILVTLMGGAYYAKIELERKYASKSQDVFMLPSSHLVEPDDNKDARKHYHYTKRMNDDDNDDDDDDNDDQQEKDDEDRYPRPIDLHPLAPHPLQINALLTKQRSFTLAPADRDLEEGVHTPPSDPPVLKIVSPR